MSDPRPILVVDDNPEDVFFLRKRLLAAGIRNPLVTFDQPEHVIVFLTASQHHDAPGSVARPLLLIADLKLIGMSGLELLRWVRLEKSCQDLPVLMLSSSENPQDAQMAKSLGASDFLIKFPPVSRLRAAVAALDPKSNLARLPT